MKSWPTGRVNKSGRHKVLIEEEVKKMVKLWADTVCASRAERADEIFKICGIILVLTKLKSGQACPPG